MILNLIKVKDIAPSGKQPGIFLEVTRISRKDDEGHDVDNLAITVELDTTDKSGKKRQLTKEYKMGAGSRGLSTFRNDYHEWSGRKLKDQDLVAFDADALLKGKRATFVITHRKEGKEMVAVLDKFLPAAALAQEAGI